MARCWPDGNLRFTTAGLPDCAPDAVNPGEGRKSFPSGMPSRLASLQSTCEAPGCPEKGSVSCKEKVAKACTGAGHTSWSTSGLAYLTFWLAGWMRCFDGSGHPTRLVLAGLPISSAAWIGVTRLQVDFAGTATSLDRIRGNRPNILRGCRITGITGRTCWQASSWASPSLTSPTGSTTLLS